jgi:hypothetical protein
LPEAETFTFAENSTLALMPAVADATPATATVAQVAAFTPALPIASVAPLTWFASS